MVLMCGISGLFEYSRFDHVEAERVRAMNQTIAHRGPDDDGVYVGPGIGLGHRRLSIIDLAGGHQPMSNEDGSIQVLLNGEIYNFPELFKEIVAAGHTLKTRSDTEAVVHLYEDHGEGVFAKLRGMFAVAIWDSRKRKLILGRDRLGKKPLFYDANDKRIVFASELKAILAEGSVSREIDPLALSDFFSFGYIPAPKTIYKSTRKVLPGHYLVASAQGIAEKKYWDVSFDNVDHSRSEESWCEEIREKLKEATRIRLMSDVPLGAFLSGGVDSSSVVAMMAQLMDRPVTTCSIGFTESEYDESAYAREIAKHFGTDHYDQIVEPNALEIMDKLVWHYDEPFADSSAIPTYYVSKIARSRVTVALGGDGGDEAFAGYRRYYFDQFENRLRKYVPGGIRRAVFGPLGRIYPPLAWAPRIFRGKATFQSLSRSPLEGYFNSVSIFRPTEKPLLLSGDFRAQLAGYESIDVFRQYYDRSGSDDLLTRIQYLDMKTYLPDDILAKVDRASMAVSLEVRAPLLDHELIELSARIPSSLKLRGTDGKYILKKAMLKTVPRDALYRKKQGFAIPLDRWFRKDIKDMAYEMVVKKTDGYLDQKYLRKIWDDHQSGYFDRAAYLWAVLMFRKWHEQFSAAPKVAVGATIGAKG